MERQKLLPELQLVDDNVGRDACAVPRYLQFPPRSAYRFIAELMGGGPKYMLSGR